MFGLSPGKIDIQIPRTNFKQGETIEGTLALTLKKPIKARAVRIRLLATRTEHYGKSSRTITICDLAQDLDGEKEYPASDSATVYPFKIQIPLDAVKKDFGEGALGSILGAAQSLGNLMSRITWTLKASLDIPMGLDVAKDLRINVTE